LLHHYNIDDDFLDSSGLTKATITDYTKLDSAYWLAYCIIVHKFLTTMFTTGIYWRALAVIQEAFLHGDPMTIPAEDARRFLQSADRINYHDVDADDAVEIIRGLVRFTYQFQRYCPDFLRRHYPGV
jgi:hypothetical protein